VGELSDTDKIIHVAQVARACGDNGVGSAAGSPGGIDVAGCRCIQASAAEHEEEMEPR